jgi:hypothetical protein
LLDGEVAAAELGEVEEGFRKNTASSSRNCYPGSLQQQLAVRRDAE